MANGAIHSFVPAAALELRNGLRINVVSAGLVEDAVEKRLAFFPGHNPIPMAQVVNGQVRSVGGKGTRQIIGTYDMYGWLLLSDARAVVSTGVEQPAPILGRCACMERP
jgi:hypothetical protein